MPIRGLDETRKQTAQIFLQRIPPAAFKKTRICIDGGWFLRKYLNAADVHRAFLHGMETAVAQPLQRLTAFRDANEVDLLWVWDGIDFERPQGASQLAPEASVDQGFREHSLNNHVKAGRLWRSVVARKSEMDAANRILAESGISVVTAPYSATAQCAYFMSAGVCSYIFGKSDVLLFEGVDKVILDMFVEDGRATYLEVFHKNRFLEFFGLNSRQFTVLGLMLGCDFCPTVPQCANDFSFEKVFGLVKGVEEVVKMIRGGCEEEVAKRYIEQLFKGLVLVNHLPVMKISGAVLPYCEDHVPRNLDKLVGARLAPGFYEALFLNRISYTQLHAQQSGETRLEKIAEAVLLKTRKGQGRSVEDQAAAESLFAGAVCPGIVLTDDLDVSAEMLLMMSVGLNEMEAPFVPKILCLLGKQSEGAEMDLQTLRFYVRVAQMFSTMRETREMSELLGRKGIERLFCMAPVLFCASVQEWAADKKNARMLGRVERFLRANEKLGPVVGKMAEEVGQVLRK